MHAELHLHTCYSFLDGASHPEELATTATSLGYGALAICCAELVCPARSRRTSPRSVRYRRSV